MCNTKPELISARSDEAEIKPVTECEIPEEIQRLDFGPRYWSAYLILCHLGFVYYFLYLLPLGYVPLMTFPAAYIWGILTGGLGLTVGAHRYFTHKTFKAKKPLQYLLMLMFHTLMHKQLYYWVRDHRIHHKFMDTDADPHNVQRGFIFSHIGWLVMPKHPKLIEASKVIDMSDIVNDPVVRFQAKYWWTLNFITVFLIPISLFMWMFPEGTLFQQIAGVFARLCVESHLIFSINSFAHMFGDRPYDKYISPTDGKFLGFMGLGDGFHNYHHTFPWDYNASEFYGLVNISSLFIHFMARIGWAYDLKTVSHAVLRARINRTGEVSHPMHLHHGKDSDSSRKDDDPYGSDILTARGCWGWGDKNMTDEDMQVTERLLLQPTR